MRSRGWSLVIACLLIVAATSPRLAAQEKPPGERLTSSLETTLHILGPVPITDEKHAANEAEATKVKVGDKVLIRITYDPAKMPVKEVELRFASKRMAACEIVRAPQARSKNKKEATDSVAIVVRATAAKSCTAGIDCTLADGSKKTLYFMFEIEAK
jgi:hypothetical protein